MGIPTVMGAVDLPYSGWSWTASGMIVDGYLAGEVFTNPSAELCKQYRAVVEEERQLVKGWMPCAACLARLSMATACRCGSTPACWPT